MLGRERRGGTPSSLFLGIVNSISLGILLKAALRYLLECSFQEAAANASIYLLSAAAAFYLHQDARQRTPLENLHIHFFRIDEREEKLAEDNMPFNIIIQTSRLSACYILKSYNFMASRT